MVLFCQIPRYASSSHYNLLRWLFCMAHSLCPCCGSTCASKANLHWLIRCRISEELLPTPAKSHYTFNLRDLSKQFQGMLMVSPSSCSDKEALARLWMHEACRVFADRLVCYEDRQYFQKMLVS
jgi:hypothetical protein